METSIRKELEQLKGVGSVLAQRLVEAGMDSFARVAEAGEAGLKEIRGINPRSIPAILAQAQELTETAQAGPDERLLALRETAARLQQQAQDLASRVRELQPDKLQGKKGERFETELAKLLNGLQRLEAQPGTRLKRARKRLAKTGKRLDGLTPESVKGATRCLKKARKPLKRSRA